MKQFNFRNTSVLFLTALLCLTSCNKELDELSINPNQVTVETFFTTPESVNSGVLGVYAYITTPRNLGAQGSKMDYNRGDESSSNADYGLPGQFNSTLTPTWYTIVQPYALMYTAASQATQIIAIAPEITFDDEVKRNAYMGEAYCLRAFAHFWLLIHYRNISIIDEAPQDKSDFIRPQEDPMTVWNFIIEDLKKAKELLPIKDYWHANDVGRVSKGSAAALLGKVYLYMSGIEEHYGTGGVNKYSEAAKEFSNIIDGKYGSYSLMENYSDNFNIAHENNSESLLEFQFRGDLVNTAFNPGFPNSGVFNDNRGLMPPGRGYGFEIVVHDWLYETFVASKDAEGYTDIRMFGTLMFDDTAPEINIPDRNGDGEPDYRLTGIAGQTWEEMYPPSNGKTGFATLDREDAEPYKACFRKWLDLTLPATDPGNNELWAGGPRSHGVNWRYIRLADVLLMYAESVLMGGEQGSITPLEAINRVRARADMPLLASVTMDDIKKERILELSLEGHRFFDLLRWGVVADRFAYLDATDPHFKEFSNLGYGGFTEGKDEWLPIPLDEVAANPDAQQNPGW